MPRTPVDPDISDDSRSHRRAKATVVVLPGLADPDRGRCDRRLARGQGDTS